MLPTDFIIKVCGMTVASECKALIESGVTHTGFIIYAPSPRNALDMSADEIREIGNYFQSVGVFVDSSTENILDITAQRNIKAVQLHGNESPDECVMLRESGLKVIKAFRIGPDFTCESLLEMIAPYENTCDLFLFDAGGKLAGGNGVKFNWNILEGYKGKTEYILSGGIGPGDVEAVKKFIGSNPGQLKGIDINSGFELSPGHKNVETVKNFIYELSN